MRSSLAAIMSQNLSKFLRLEDLKFQNKIKQFPRQASASARHNTDNIFTEIRGERSAHIWLRVSGFIFLETFRRFKVKFY